MNISDFLKDLDKPAIVEAAGNENRPADTTDQAEPETAAMASVDTSMVQSPATDEIEPEQEQETPEVQPEQGQTQPIETAPTQDSEESKEDDEEPEKEDALDGGYSESTVEEEKKEKVIVAPEKMSNLPVVESDDSFQEQFTKSLQEGTEFKLELQLDGLFESQGFESEFSKQAKEIFESAVTDVTKNHLAKVNAYAAHVMESFMAEKMEEMEKEVETKLNEAVAAWAESNKIGIEQGVRVQVAESFMEKLGTVLKEHFVEVPKEKADLYESSLDVVKSSNDKLVESESIVESLKAELLATKKQLCLESFVSDCTVMQSEKIKELAKELMYESDESFKKKLTILKESYVEKKSTKKVESIVEDVTPVIEAVIEEQVGDRDIIALANSMSKLSNKF
jgi:hypothetical protein